MYNSHNKLKTSKLLKSILNHYKFRSCLLRTTLFLHKFSFAVKSMCKNQIFYRQELSTSIISQSWFNAIYWSCIIGDFSSNQTNLLPNNGGNSKSKFGSELNLWCFCTQQILCSYTPWIMTIAVSIHYIQLIT